jgi:hypothetical protein
MHTTLKTQFARIMYLRSYIVIPIWSLYNDSANTSEYTP